MGLQNGIVSLRLIAARLSGTVARGQASARPDLAAKALQAMGDAEKIVFAVRPVC